MEGIGYDFFPEVLDTDPSIIDEWIKVNDDDAFKAAKNVIRTEALAVGGSSGSAMAGALKFLHSKQGQAIASDSDANVVVILPDGVRNYMSKPWFLDVAPNEEADALREKVRSVLGRELNDPSKKT